MATYVFQVTSVYFSVRNYWRGFLRNFAIIVVSIFNCRGLPNHGLLWYIYSLYIIYLHIIHANIFQVTSIYFAVRNNWRWFLFNSAINVVSIFSGRGPPNLGLLLYIYSLYMIYLHNIPANIFQVTSVYFAVRNYWRRFFAILQ